MPYVTLCVNTDSPCPPDTNATSSSHHQRSAADGVWLLEVNSGGADDLTFLCNKLAHTSCQHSGSLNQRFTKNKKTAQHGAGAGLVFVICTTYNAT